MLNCLILNVWCLLAIKSLWSETIPFLSAFLVSLDIVDETKRGWGWWLEGWWEGGGGLVEVRQARWGCEWQLQTPVCETVKSEVYRCTLLWPVHTSETSCCSHHHPTNRFLFNTKLPRRDEVIKLVSGYQAVRKIYIVSYSVRDILGGDFSPCCTVPQSLCQSSLHQCLSAHRAPSETKQSASNSRLANIGRTGLSLSQW